MKDENGDWMFIARCERRLEVDTSTYACNCRMFVTCNYHWHHILLTYIGRQAQTGKVNQL